ncbi:MAG: hypothetical protein KKE64_05600 [Candidatus Omnitrophica bacterium]|nr:hypothetical protein [Candidatus Omnitrophota bacterium]
MRLREKGQSTAEYAILIGLVVAVAAGFLSVSLKGAMRSKNEQATNLLLVAGDDVLGSYGTGASDIPLYVQEVSKTTVQASDYINTAVLEKGGSEKKLQKQTTQTTAVSVETLDGTN